MKTILASAVAQAPITVLVAHTWDFSDWQLWAGAGAKVCACREREDRSKSSNETTGEAEK